MADNICPIPGDADIAGIGVRAAIYAQAFFVACSTACLDFIVQSYAPEGERLRRIYNSRDTGSMVQAAIEYHDARRNEPTPDHASYFVLSKNLERPILMVGFAVMVSAIIQLKNTNGLTPYHTLIVLNISLINSCTGVYLVSSREGFHPVRYGRCWNFRRAEDFLNFIPLAAHSMMLSGFGVYFWMLKQNTLAPFLKYANESAPCRPLTYFWVFGPVDSTSQSLKITSLVFYIVIFPLLGYHLILVLKAAIRSVLYALIYCGCIIVLLVIFFLCILPSVSFLALLINLACLIPHINRRLPGDHPLRHCMANSLMKTFSVFDSLFKHSDMPLTVISGLLAYSSPIIYFVVSTESIVKLNAPYIEPGDREDDWTYGQTLAIFTVSVTIFLTGRDRWRILREERRKWLERKNASDGEAGAVELGNLQEPENAVAAITSEPAPNTDTAPTPPVASTSSV
ncbi:hypothetical protein E1B28_003148 [Marasmius oreades]|uniref:Uncharacterized protein n=1 Tax=Marasmius oreades TaxID=181124 RepID=A0A9P7RLL6_9AGAR|nr:uncharacterized protein E1B28_003148 [Marasmius oreades]KAG7085597.1 hypothetical protein E1B28_003148 [Marasmius oreades]